MKTTHPHRGPTSPAPRAPRPAPSGQAGFIQGGILLMTLTMIGVSLLILSATMRRTATVANLNERNNQLAVNLNAAEAAVEKTVARMSYDFQNYGLGQMNANLPLYRSYIPTTTENSFWSNYQFSDGLGHTGSNYVAHITNYSGPLPSQYPGRTCIASPVYRVLSNVRAPNSRHPELTAAVQVDVLAALVPITQWAIFYNGLLEFSSCATMTVNGPVHANGSVYTGSSSVLTLNGTVTTTGTQSSPANNGTSTWSKTGVFNGSPPKSENVPVISLAIGTNMANVHTIIEMPTPGVLPTNSTERARLYNLAQVVLLVSNTTVTAKIQTAPSAGEVPGNDPSPTQIGPIYTTNYTAMASNFPFLVTTNIFTDQRESYTGARKVYAADVDLAKYKAWITTNTLRKRSEAERLILAPVSTTPYCVCGCPKTTSERWKQTMSRNTSA